MALRIRTQREAARQTGREVLLEVVPPVAPVRPATGAACGAIDRERVGETRVAERHHRYRESRGDLPDLPGGALGRKYLDARRVHRWLGGERDGCGQENETAEDDPRELEI